MIHRLGHYQSNCEMQLKRKAFNHFYRRNEIPEMQCSHGPFYDCRWIVRGVNAEFKSRRPQIDKSQNKNNKILLAKQEIEYQLDWSVLWWRSVDNHQVPIAHARRLTRTLLVAARQSHSHNCRLICILRVLTARSNWLFSYNFICVDLWVNGDWTTGRLSSPSASRWVRQHATQPLCVIFRREFLISPPTDRSWEVEKAEFISKTNRWRWHSNKSINS